MWTIFCYHHFHLNIVVVLKPADKWIQGGKYIISHQLYLLPEMIKNLNYCNYSYLFLLFLKYQAQFWKSNFSAFFQSWLIILKVFWINNHIEFPLLNWMNIFWMNILDFALNWILNWGPIQWKNELSKKIAHP